MSGNDRVRVRRGSESDIELLANLSRQRSREQHRDVDVGTEQLMERLRDRMGSDSVAFLFEVDGKVVGYTLVSQKVDPLSVLEYYLIPEERGKGYGYALVAMTMSATNSSALDVDSTVWREAAGAM